MKTRNRPDYPGYRPNFCFEKKWNKASKAEIGLAATEDAVGVATEAFLVNKHRCLTC
jgi:hypothetical protein